MLNVCIVGCGARGKGHAQEWQKRKNSRVVAVCDALEDRLRALAEETGASAYVDWRDAVLHEGVDVVSICTPSHSHADITCLAAENGRHVFGEKPMALTVEQGEIMLDCTRRAGVVYMPCFQYRDMGVYRRYRELFQAHRFGGPVVFRFTDIREVRPKTAMHSRSANGGPIVDMACHVFDLMRWITGEEAIRVYASGGVFGKGKPRLAEIADLAIDQAVVEVTMRGGHQLHAYFNWGMPEDFPGVSSEQWMVGPELAARPADGNMEVLCADHRELWPLGENPGTGRRVERMVQAIHGESAPDITGEDALAALRISHMALESIETGQAVEVG